LGAWPEDRGAGGTWRRWRRLFTRALGRPGYGHGGHLEHREAAPALIGRRSRGVLSGSPQERTELSAPPAESRGDGLDDLFCGAAAWNSGRAAERGGQRAATSASTDTLEKLRRGAPARRPPELDWGFFPGSVGDMPRSIACRTAELTDPGGGQRRRAATGAGGASDGQPAPDCARGWPQRGGTTLRCPGWRRARPVLGAHGHHAGGGS